MLLKKVEELQGNEILAKTLMTWDYQIILQRGSIIRLEYIDKLKNLGVEELYIKEQEEKLQESIILKAEIENCAKEKVKDILERHTYKRNHNLAELKNTANNIINTILEEESVVEKVYEIKEREPDVYEHSISICSLAILTALKLKVNKDVIMDMGVACLLHDIGLRYITADYSNRGIEELTEKERADYKKHPVYGYTALEEESWISKRVKNIILFHHERLDGSGFPFRKTEIPIECKIVNVCDAFDEMICGVACKKGKVYESIEYLKVFRGIKFDSEVVDTFLQFIAVYPSGTYVLTNEQELAVVIGQNKDFPDRPIIRITKDRDGNPVNEEVIKNLVEVHNIFIERALC